MKYLSLIFAEENGYRPDEQTRLAVKDALRRLSQLDLDNLATEDDQWLFEIFAGPFSLFIDSPMPRKKEITAYME